MCDSRTPVKRAVSAGVSGTTTRRPAVPEPPLHPVPYRSGRYAPSTGAAAWMSSACSPVTR